MTLDKDGHSKGFAFIEFEDEVGPFCYYCHVGHLMRPAETCFSSIRGKQQGVQKAAHSGHTLRFSCPCQGSVGCGRAYCRYEADTSIIVMLLQMPRWHDKLT